MLIKGIFCRNNIYYILAQFVKSLQKVKNAILVAENAKELPFSTSMYDFQIYTFYRSLTVDESFQSAVKSR